jgi:hypothetical protein
MVEPHALRFGEEAALSIRSKRKQWDEALDYRERETIEAYLSLPPPQRKIVREVIQAFTKVFAAKK